ncbi:hypothetical protein HMPREF2736_07260 [Corynebacterium sp. HMSC036E10]|uniref:hypothetical protein n=1 Tax=Corynebacterium sp. HMSC036E10 TaxID=1715215 RepID=UPI0008A89FED|nr:hypothetical protein [Corynebacterium sp. HMSC036E10]OHO81176.1 hypothetical protein HMPREF2736_07260 [Corynebacterium sp. HMSC036E10]
MTKNARISALAAAVVAGVAAFWGGWTRRWMSDDGLIVLRTVRNLLAGNGPVFNAGERVEANTSTLWQYLITLFGWLTDARLESIAMWLALLCTAAAAATAAYASGKFWGRVGPVIPFGIIIYIALPPARDFATSGLEWGMSLLWIAIWWAALVAWAEDPVKRRAPYAGYFLAFWSGLSWLVRPELALYGGVAGIMLIAFSPRKTLGILAVALPVPAGYQLFRMGYYGLITPHTAVAKSASGSEWARGWEYFADFFGYYWLALPLLGAAAVAVWLLWGARGRRLAIVCLTTGVALAHMLYVLRVGGDFMHGRMWLLPLFALLLPMMAVPYTKVTAAVGTALVVWASVIVLRAHPIDWEPYNNGEKELGIVDERDFWTMAVGRDAGDPPLYAEDFLGSKLMWDWNEAIEQGLDEDAAQISLAIVTAEPERYKWFVRERQPDATDQRDLELTAYMVNLGMTSMNSPLNTRILDTVGLATPIAARMPRVPDGRIGHDKELGLEWQVADTDADLDKLPQFVDKQKAQDAREALRSDDIADLLATSREPMSWDRFWANVRYSLGPGRTLTLDDDPTHYLSHTSPTRQIAWPSE